MVATSSLDLQTEVRLVSVERSYPVQEFRTAVRTRQSSVDR